MPYTCPEGHTSAAGDYCDVCGAPIPAGAGSSAPSPAAGPARATAAGPPGGGAGLLDLDAPPVATDKACPNCGTSNLPDALYCENCGYDFTTGQLPRPLDPPAGVPAAGDTGAIGLGAGVVPSGVLPPAPPIDAPPATLPAPPATDIRGADAVPVDAAADVAAAVDGAPVDGAPDVAAPDVAAPDVAAADLPTKGSPVLAPPVTPTSAPGHVEWVAEVWVDPDWYASQDVTDPCPSAGVPWVVPVLERSVLVGRVSHSRNIHPQIDVSTDSGVSRRHAQLTSDGQRWWVEDLQSANGTYVGEAGDPLPTTPIMPGQRVELDEDDRLYVGAWTRIVVRRATADEADLGA